MVLAEHEEASTKEMDRRFWDANGDRKANSTAFGAL